MHNKDEKYNEFIYLEQHSKEQPMFLHQISTNKYDFNLYFNQPY
jgi:hypothetical protein